MRVLVVASWYPDTGNTVRGSFFRQQANALAAAGHYVTVLAAERNGPRSIFEGRGFAQLGRRGFAGVDEGGVRVYRNIGTRLLPAGLFPLSAKQGMEQDASRFASELSRARGPFDIIHAQSAYWGGAVADALSRILCIPFVVQEHRSNFLNDTLGRRARSALESIFARASFVMAVSDGILTRLRSHYGVSPEKSGVLPNMVSPGFLGTARNKSSNYFRFAMVAALVPIKRHDLAFRAFAEVSRTNSDIELHVVGDGPSRPALERLAKELGIVDRVRWYGWRVPAELPPLYESFDALVLSSDHETFGVVLAEAWASGIPVIATRSGGPDSLVKPFNGILVEKGNPAALAQAMVDLMRRRTEFDVETIRDNARREYGEDAVIAKTMSIYAQAIHGHHSPGHRQ